MDELAGVRLRGFALAFDRLAEASTFVFQRKIFELHLRSFLLIVVVLLSLLCGFAVAFERLAFNLNAYFSNCIS